MALAEPRQRALLAALPYLLLGVVLLWTFPITPDDDFITLRYARNLLDGHGAVFNVGERVEGYSSPLHLLLSAGVLALAGNHYVIVASKLLGVLFAGVSLAQTRRLVVRLGMSTGDALLAQLLVVLNVNFAISAVNCLETSLYGCLLLAVATRTLEECMTDVTRPRLVDNLSAFLVFVCVLTRPDAMLLFPILLVLRVVASTPGRFRVRDIALWCAFFLVPFGAFILFRLAYYGLPLPNTFYAKAGDLLHGASNGLRYLARPLSPKSHDLLRGESLPVKLLLLGSAASFWALAGLGFWTVRRERKYWLVSGVLATAIAFVLKSGGDWMQGWRFAIVAAPVAAIFQVLAVRAIAARFPAGASKLVATAPVAVWLLAAAVAPKRSWAEVGFSLDGVELLSATGAGPEGLGKRQVAAAKLLTSKVPTGATVALTEIGVAGFLNMDKVLVDMRGLTNHQIATLKGVYKSAEGVSDSNWFEPHSAVGQVVRERAPYAIMAFENVPTALQSYVNRGGSGEIYLYVRSDISP